MIALNLTTTHENGRTIGGINSSHEDLSRESTSLNDGLGIGNNVSIDLVNTNILHVDVAHQTVQHFAFSMTHVVLQLSQQGNSGRRGHTLEHILLPVFAFNLAFGRNFGVQVALNNLALTLVGHHLGDAFTVAVHSIIEFLTPTLIGCQHNVGGCFQILLIADVVDIAVFAIAFLDDSNLQFLGQVIERVTHLSNILRLIVPLLYLGRIGLHLFGKVLIDTLVGLNGILRSQFNTVGNDGEAF